MSDDAVGAYINEHFFSSYQKVGTFSIVDGQKQGGNVAAYFCLSDGTVLDAIAGPVSAKEFLQAARWVVETRKTAITETRSDPFLYSAYFRKAHAERYLEQYANPGLNNQGIVRDPASGKIVSVTQRWQPGPGANAIALAPQAAHKLPLQRPANMSKQAQVEWLLASRTSPKIGEIYKTVYQDILGERVSNLPILER